MDMNLREWLLLIGAVILVGILVDGYRRMRRAKRDSMEISRGMAGHIDVSPLDEGFNPELPNGGARVVARDPAHHSESNEFEEEFDAVLANQSPAELNLSAMRQEPDFDLEDQDDVMVAEEELLVQSKSTEAVESFRVAESQQAAATAVAERQEAPVETAKSNKPKFGSRLTGKSSFEHKTSKAAEAKRAAGKSPQELIVINVFSKEEEGFSGYDLRRLVEACGLEFGEMSIFNRHEHGFSTGPVQFSMANLVEPGTFDLDVLDEQGVPGVCFFLNLPGPEDSMKAFDYMLETAQCIVRNLKGELKDERRSVFTQQTIEHCRQRVREFERRQQLAARV